MPMLDLGIYGPASRPENDEFWNEPSGEMVGALYSPEAGYINDPQLAAHNLQRAAEAKGGVFRYRTEVVGITTENARCVGVELGDGSSVSAGVVINVAGPHSSNVNKLAGQYDKMNITTQALRHETYHMSGPPNSSFSESGSVTIDEDNGIYFRPQSGNNIMMGTTDPACDPHVVVDADDDLGELSVEGWEVNTLRINKRIPSLGVPLPHEKKGLVACYDKSDDWIPIYDRTDLDGYYVAIGTSGNQFKNAGVAGHMMAELIEAVENGHDHDADPLVVTARYTGHPINMAAYRRNREIDTRSSMSVIG
jgi:sarcosine oxidase subunit beta